VTDPACVEYIPSPEDGFRAVEDDSDLRGSPCGYCFPETDDVEDIDEDTADLVAGVGPYSDRVHRHERTGPIEHTKTNQGGVGEIAHRISDPEFGFDDLDKAGGDA